MSPLDKEKSTPFPDGLVEYVNQQGQSFELKISDGVFKLVTPSSNTSDWRNHYPLYQRKIRDGVCYLKIGPLASIVVVYDPINSSYSAEYSVTSRHMKDQETVIETPTYISQVTQWFRARLST